MHLWGLLGLVIVDNCDYSLLGRGEGEREKEETERQTDRQTDTGEGGEREGERKTYALMRQKHVRLC